MVRSKYAGLSDKDFILRYPAGEKDEVGDYLYRNHSHSVRRRCMGLVKNIDDVDELTQTVFQQFFQFLK